MISTRGLNMVQGMLMGRDDITSVEIRSSMTLHITLRHAPSAGMVCTSDKEFKLAEAVFDSKELTKYLVEVTSAGGSSCLTRSLLGPKCPPTESCAVNLPVRDEQQLPASARNVMEYVTSGEQRHLPHGTVFAPDEGSESDSIICSLSSSSAEEETPEKRAAANLKAFAFDDDQEDVQEDSESTGVESLTISLPSKPTRKGRPPAQKKKPVPKNVTKTSRTGSGKENRARSPAKSQGKAKSKEIKVVKQSPVVCTKRSRSKPSTKPRRNSAPTKQVPKPKLSAYVIMSESEDSSTDGTESSSGSDDSTERDSESSLDSPPSKGRNALPQSKAPVRRPRRPIIREESSSSEEFETIAKIIPTSGGPSRNTRRTSVLPTADQGLTGKRKRRTSLFQQFQALGLKL